MPHIFYLFDMDGVLLEPGGYQKALINSVRRIGQALGAPNTTITKDQIARFEALNITNEWDTLAICAALTLVHLWKITSDLRLDMLNPKVSPLTNKSPDFDTFLMAISDGGHQPGETAYHYLINHHPWLDADQRAYLAKILENCSDIFQSLTLPAHQETVLGSKIFEAHYKIKAQGNIDSFLAKYDKPILTEDKSAELRKWLNYSNHHAGILTNRPSCNPPGYLSSPEAEMGIEIVGLTDLPYVGSGILGWFAVNYCQLPDYLLLKPNPVHALTLLQRCLGRSLTDSLHASVALWQGSGDLSDWEAFDKAKIVIFEDSTKGLLSGKAACDLINNMGFGIDLTLIGIAQNSIKLTALNQVSSYNIDNINQINWFEIKS